MGWLRYSLSFSLLCTAKCIQGASASGATIRHYIYTAVPPPMDLYSQAGILLD